MAEMLEMVTDTPAAPNGTATSQADGAALPPPDFGRTVRVVGPVIPVDTSQLPHPKNQRGELGKALFNWYNNTVSKDPFVRVSAPNHFADKRNYLTTVIGQAPKAKVNPRRVPVAL